MPWEELDGMDDMTPEDIITAQIIWAFDRGDCDGSDIIKALTDAGKIIVDRSLLEDAERVLAWNVGSKNAGEPEPKPVLARIQSAMTTNTGS